MARPRGREVRPRGQSRTDRESIKLLDADCRPLRRERERKQHGGGVKVRATKRAPGCRRRRPAGPRAARALRHGCALRWAGGLRAIRRDREPTARQRPPRPAPQPASRRRGDWASITGFVLCPHRSVRAVQRGRGTAQRVAQGLGRPDPLRPAVSAPRTAPPAQGPRRRGSRPASSRTRPAAPPASGACWVAARRRPARPTLQIKGPRVRVPATTCALARPFFRHRAIAVFYRANRFVVCACALRAAASRRGARGGLGIPCSDSSAGWPRLAEAGSIRASLEGGLTVATRVARTLSARVLGYRPGGLWAASLRTATGGPR